MGVRRPVRTVDNLTTFMCRWSWNLEPQPPGTLMACPEQYRDFFNFFSFRTQDCGIWPVEHSSCLTLPGHCGRNGVTLLHLLPWVTSNLLSDADEILSFILVTSVQLRTTQVAFGMLVWEFRLTCFYKCGWCDKLEKGRLRGSWVRMAQIGQRQYFNEWLAKSNCSFDV